MSTGTRDERTAGRLDPLAEQQPAPSGAPRLPDLGVLGLLRFAWRQLTSMRTALFLLLLLAVAAVPGSVLPQRGIDAQRVTTYLADHRTSGPWLDRLGFFDVYSSVWFSAIYLLLFISLVGCVVPRSRQHLQHVRSRPPRAPRRLDRLPAHERVEVDASPDVVLRAAREALRRRRFRLEQRDDDPAGASLSGERGHLREAGNLIFHLSLVVLLCAVAAGHLWGWRGDVVVPVGDSFADVVGAYDTIDPGPWVDSADLPPFTVRVDDMTVKFEEQAAGNQRGAPREFRAGTTVTDSPGAPPRRREVSVNHPLTIDGAKVFLLGNGYAPVITVRDSKGAVIYRQATPFLSQDGNYTSLGVVKVPGASPRQIGLVGNLLPTAQLDASGNAVSVFPDARNPRLVMQAWAGDLGLGNGRPQSVYRLDTQKMERLPVKSGAPLVILAPGQSVTLGDGAATVSFDKLQRFAGLSVRHDPGRGWALGGAVAAIGGLVLSLFVRRRRVFVRVVPAAGGSGSRRTVVDVGALARGEDTGLADEIAAVVAAAKGAV